MEHDALYHFRATRTQIRYQYVRLYV